MSNFLIKTAVRRLFGVTSREKALHQSAELMGKYAELAKGLTQEEGKTSIKVPPMRGVDEDMRRWSFFMILEHNAIVNRSITAITCQLARGETLGGPARIDPKNDVMPSPTADASQLEEFKASVVEHIDAVKELGKLRGTQTAPHPVFGNFDAHQWNCMFAFHLRLHLPQAEYVAEGAKGVL